MKARRFVPLALAAVALGACGSSKETEVAASYCPAPLTVQDASRLTRFKAGAGRVPRVVMFEAVVVAADTACTVSRNRMEVDVAVRIAVNAGPSIGQGVTRVPFFVRVVNGNGGIVVGRDELADYKLSTASPRGVSQEELSVTIPFSEVKDLGGYRIAVGLKPTAEELDYNRRAAVRQ